jgi:RecB family endonuclease NucS
MIGADDVSHVTDQESISEEDISHMISTFPELIEEGLKFMDTEVEISGGRIDAVFRSKNDEHLLIEIEIEARDNAIGQVQRFITYAEKYGIPRDRIRLGIVCAKISESRLNACIGAGVEVYTLSLEKRA